jgi:hypothetical protein
MSLFNPWVLLGIIMSVMSAFGGGYYKGKSDEHTRQQLEIAALNTKARETEQAMAQVAQTYGQTLRKANNAAKLKEDKLRADIAGGNLRLSIPTQSGVCPTSVASVTAGDNSGEARTEPSGSATVAADLLQIAADGDIAIRKLNSCIQTYETLRNMK